MKEAFWWNFEKSNDTDHCLIYKSKKRGNPVTHKANLWLSHIHFLRCILSYYLYFQKLVTQNQIFLFNDALCSPLTERASHVLNSSADHPLAQPVSSPVPSHISSPPGFVPPAEINIKSTISKSKCRNNWDVTSFLKKMEHQTYFGMIFMQAQHRFGVELLFCHHQREHLLAVSTHNQL